MTDRLRAWIDELSSRPDVDEDLELKRLRSRAVAVDPDLRALAHQHLNRAHVAIAAAVAADTGLAPDDAGPQMLAAAAIAMFDVVQRLAVDDKPAAAREFALGFEVLRAALASVKAQAAGGRNRDSGT